MEYKVCILAAGIGSRMSEFSEHLNKVLLPLKGKPVICHIIEKFPKEVEIIIAVGHKRNSLICYLEKAYPNRKLTFVVVDKYFGKGSGPGYSLFACKEHLQCPFIHIAGDTLVTEKISSPNSNWLGVAEVEDTRRFCSAKVEGDKVVRLDDKIKTDNKHAYIGLIGVYDWEAFWESLANNSETIEGEVQVSHGINALLKKNLSIKSFTWFDTGVPSSYKYACENYPHGKGYSGE
ncbi:NTP transferase domain-containing protein [archaeon]|nr:NTP transferase domain-containing protein [archaeon]